MSKKKKQDEEWRHEQAMEAGMLHGIDAYNEVLGYDTSPPPQPDYDDPPDQPDEEGDEV